MIPITTTHKTVFFEWLCRAKDGHEFWTDNASRVVRFGDRDVFLSTIRDVTERRKASAEISYRDRLLHTLAFSTAELVKGASHDSSLSRVLEAFGHQLAGDRLLIVQLTNTDDPTVRYAWQRSNVRPVDVAELAAAAFKAGNAPTIRAWLAPLREGKPVVTKLVNATGIARAMLEAGDVVSAVFLPIFVNGAYWGYFSVDDTGLERDWTPIEMEALKTFADVIGATLAREQAETSLKRSEEQFRTVSATVLDGIIMIGKDGRIRFWNPSAARIFGYTATEAQGQSIEMLAPERFRRKASRRLAAFFATDDWPVSDLTVELAATRKDGTEIAVELAINAMRVGIDQYAVGVVRDVTARKSSSELIERLASHDALTGLPNRRWFMAALDNEIARARRSGETFAVLYMDLDNFKDVNDRLGHPAGDNLLLAVAQRLKASVREVDTVARFGGDEFAAIQSNVRDPANAELLARKIVLALGEPFTLDGTELQSSTSLGIAVYSPESPDGESLLAHADVALYLAKSEGRGTYRFYTDAMEADLRVNTALIADLRKAIALQQFFLLYEPRVDRSGRIIGLEATPRWQHPERGVLEPAQFMAAAEKSGLINPLGGWIIREACRQTRAWIEEGVAPPYVAMIVSAQQFNVPQDAHESVQAIVVESGVPPTMLEVELRESGLTEASSRYKPALLALLALGVHITIDDFGNGYSSLEVLHRFPIWRIKIPRNFIVNLSTRSANAPLVRATLSLARELGIPVIAEGVETEAQAALLSAWGCKELQGSYFAKPLSADKMSTLLRVGKIRPVPAPSSARTLSLIYDEDGPPAGTPAKQT
jgi:diguanylate cyclase (GGDEF)-like protein/PAS domain S-box-containing protein